MSSFPYLPISLEKFEIRLVELIPLESPTDPIKLNVHHVSLSDNPNYAALSYTWGMPYYGLPPEWDDTDATRLIYVNNHEFHVRLNLEAAVRHLCEQCDAPSLIWIDQICINQLDLEERENQIKLMKHIYQCSCATMVWLGPSSEDSDLASQAITDWADAWCQRDKTLTKYQIKRKYREKYKRLVEDEIGAQDSDARLKAVANILLRNWWKRAWVVQEVALATKILLICGSSPMAFTLQTLGSAVHLLAQHYSVLSSPDTCYSISQARFLLLKATFGASFRVSQIQNIIKFRHGTDHWPWGRYKLDFFLPRIDDPENYAQRKHATEKRSLDLPDALHSLATTLAENPRDKVYAALGMSKDADLVPVDYEMNASELFTVTSRKWIEEKGDLYFLNYCTLSPWAGVPSWAVDWGTPTYRIPFSRDNGCVRKEKIYCAGGDDAPVCFRFEGGSILILTGFSWDTVTFVGVHESDDRSYIMEMLKAHTLEELVTLQQRSSLKARDEQNLLVHWLQGWIDHQREANEYPGISRVKVGNDHEDHAFYKYTTEDVGDALRRVIIADALMSNDGTFVGRAGRRRRFKILSWMRNTVPSTLPGRTFIASRQGFMGLAPIESRVGDVICIIVGNETPLILRPKGEDKWTLVGECYIHGIMDGEAFTQFEGSFGGMRSVREFKIV
jgi:Heterokaryon incompatibility protein (HET)